jgi:FKBP-type peptidyl-prolyl cis-trans isomerase SlyD
MIVEKHKVVTLHYKLQEDDATGEMIEETFGSQPLEFIYGTGSMIPEFERQLAGMKTGDAFAFGIKSQDAYGDFNPEAIVNVPISAFVIDGRLAEELLEVGRTLPMQDDQGHRMTGIIAEVGEKEVVIDFNHPMAGVNLYFTGLVESVRDATPSEIDHGHVHGPGGHHHH